MHYICFFSNMQILHAIRRTPNLKRVYEFMEKFYEAMLRLITEKVNSYHFPNDRK